MSTLSKLILASFTAAAIGARPTDLDRLQTFAEPLLNIIRHMDRVSVGFTKTSPELNQEYGEGGFKYEYESYESFDSPHVKIIVNRIDEAGDTVDAKPVSKSRDAAVAFNTAFPNSKFRARDLQQSIELYIHMPEGNILVDIARRDLEREANLVVKSEAEIQRAQTRLLSALSDWATDCLGAKKVAQFAQAMQTASAVPAAPSPQSGPA